MSMGWCQTGNPSPTCSEAAGPAPKSIQIPHSPSPKPGLNTLTRLISKARPISCHFDLSCLLQSSDQFRQGLHRPRHHLLFQRRKPGCEDTYELSVAGTGCCKSPADVKSTNRKKDVEIDGLKLKKTPDIGIQGVSKFRSRSKS